MYVPTLFWNRISPIELPVLDPYTGMQLFVILL